MTDLDGWPTIPLGSLLIDIRPGFASGKHNSSGEGVPHFRPMNVSIEGRVERAVLKYVDPAIADRPERTLKRGDVVFNNTNSPELVGKTALFDGEDEPAFSNHMTRLRVEPSRLDPGFLAVRLHQAWREGWFAAHCNNHVSQASIGRDVLRAFEIELPPLDVQRAISALSRAVGDRRASSTKHLMAARRAVSRFRQAVLAAACSGRLTSDWREANPAVQAADSIVASIDQARRSGLGHRYKPPVNPSAEADLPDSWCWTTVGALVEVATGATPLRKRAEYYNGSIPWVTSGAVNAGLIAEASEFITDLALKETNVKIFPAGTLLVAMYGEGQTRGRVAELGIDAATNQAVAALMFDDQSQLLRPYLHLFLLENYERMRRLAFGGVQPNLSLGVIRQTELPLPPAEERIEIVRRADELLSLADRLNARIDAASKPVARSSQAVLAKAFRGDLPVAGDET
jgi:type I restriction enzyme, S subunit